MTTQSDDPRVGEACEWLVRRDLRTELSADELRRWQRWSADADNSALYAKVAQLPSLLRTLPRPQLPSAAELRACSFDLIDEDSDQLEGEEPVVVESTVISTPSRSSPSSLIVCVATRCCLAGAVLAWQAGLGPGVVFGQTGIYRSHAGEERRVQLKDGSTVRLGGDTELQAGQSRVVTLVKGEALFSVKTDPTHPFRVHAQGRTITALGTAFDVRGYSKRVQVSVTEGAVEVAPDVTPEVDKNSTRSARVRVEEGQQTTYDVDGYISPPQHADPEHAIGWTDGRFLYEERPLQEIIEDVRRYFPRPLELDPSVAQLRYTGLVRQDSLENWVKNLPMIFPVVIESTPHSVVIRSRE